MKNLRYFPFERNVFFKGKLLTVRDFELEQKYFNDKRRLLNRLVHGSGVVAGLQVVRVDDKQISVQTGVALDALGREIVVATPIKMKLAMIEGFKNNDYAKNVYLCIAYDETKKEQVYSVSNTTALGDEFGEYNRVLEGYRLFIKEEAPDLAGFEFNNVVKEQIVLYDKDQVRIWQEAPRYVNAGDVFEVKLHIEKTVQTQQVKFEYEIEPGSFSLLTAPKNSNLLAFEEKPGGKETELAASYYFKSGPEAGEGGIKVRPGTMKLTVGDRLVTIDSESSHTTTIITGPVKDRLLADYYERSLDTAVAFPSEQCVYLAKICLLQMGSTYMIEKVEKVPFGEYVYNTSLLRKLNELDGTGSPGSPDHFRANGIIEEIAAGKSPTFNVKYNDDANEFEFKLGLPKQQKISNEMTTGVVEVKLRAKPVRPFGKADKQVFSEEINHGLGAGPVCIVTGLEEVSGDNISQMLSSGEAVYFGDHDVFDDSQYESVASSVKLGAMLYPQKGTFRIGVRSRKLTEADTIRVRWWAVRQLEQIDSSGQQPNAREAAAAKEE